MTSQRTCPALSCEHMEYKLDDYMEIEGDHSVGMYILHTAAVRRLP